MKEGGGGIEHKKTKREKKFMDRDNDVVIAGRRGWEEVKEWLGETKADGRRLDLGWRTHHTVNR